jgi:hypothetical protein
MSQRSVNMAVRRAYIDFFVPSTDLQVRMGIQPMNDPSFTFGPKVIGEDVAGITASYKFNDNASVVAFWARPYNDNFNGQQIGSVTEKAGFMDNIDVFGLVVPLRFDGFKVTPWGAIGAIGPNAFRNPTNVIYDNTLLPANTSPVAGRRGVVLEGMYPRYYATHNRRGGGGLLGDRQYATAWWAGLTGEITAADPFRFAWDATYGSVTHQDAGYLNRQGWYINALAEYKLDWGVPGIYGWWGSGDNSNPKDGSESFPVMSVDNPDNMLSTFGFNGSPSVGGNYDGIFGPSGFAGTWGIGARIRDMSFLDGLKHTSRVNFMGGTNSPTMAKYITGKKTITGGAATGTGIRGDFYGAYRDNGAIGGAKGIYLTTQDYALEVNFDTIYKIYDNLDMLVELGYIHLWLDQSKNVWGAGGTKYPGVRGVSVTDAVKAAVYFRYSF